MSNYDDIYFKDPVLVALENGDLEFVQIIIDGAGLGFSKAWQDEHFLLCYALRCHQGEVALWLLSKTCRINSSVENSRSDNPLHLAIEADQDEVVQVLLEKGASVNSRNISGETPLHICCRKSNVALAKMLLSNGCEADVPDNTYFTPLHVAVESECLELVQLLLHCGVNVNSCTMKLGFVGFTPLHLAISKGNEKIVDILLQNGAYMDALINVSHMEKLCDDQIHLNIEFLNFLPLHLAATINNVCILKLLLDNGADIDATVQQNGFSAVHLAVEYQKVENLSILSEYNADFGARTKEGLDVLHLAVTNDWYELVEVLLLNGFNVNTQNQRLETPLYIAVEMGDEDLVELLLDHGANAKISDLNKQYPLHLAVEFSVAIVGILGDHIDNVDEVDSFNQTPLSIAIKHQNPEIVSQLLKYKPSCYVSANQEAFVFALKNPSTNHVDIINLLLDYGFTINQCCIDENLLYNHVSQGNFRIVEHLLNHWYGSFQKNISRTLFQRTISSKNIEMAESLTSYDWNSNAFNNMGQRLIEYLIESSQWDFVDLLLCNGLKPKNFPHLFLSAAKSDNTILIKILVKNGACVNTVDKFGTTALHFGVWNRNHDLVEYLLENGARVNIHIRNTPYHIMKDGAARGNSYTKKLLEQLFTSPLHIAVYRQYPEICATLLEHHADINFKDGLGRNCLHLASAVKSSDQMTIIEMLLKYGTDMINSVDDFNRVPLYYVYNQTCVCSIAFQNEYSLYSECECDLCEIYDIDGVIDIFVRHIAILVSMRKYVHPYNLQIISSVQNSNEMFSSCLKEISILKDEKMGFFVTFFDILTKNSNSLASCARNKGIIQTFESGYYEKKFPLYASMLKLRFHAAQNRLYLLHRALSSSSILFNCKLPDIVMNKIFDFLLLNDLKNVSLACRVARNSMSLLEKPRII